MKLEMVRAFRRNDLTQSAATPARDDINMLQVQLDRSGFARLDGRKIGRFVDAACDRKEAIREFDRRRHCARVSFQR